MSPLEKWNLMSSVPVPRVFSVGLNAICAVNIEVPMASVFAMRTQLLPSTIFPTTSACCGSQACLAFGVVLLSISSSDCTLLKQPFAFWRWSFFFTSALFWFGVWIVDSPSGCSVWVCCESGTPHSFVSAKVGLPKLAITATSRCACKSYVRLRSTKNTALEKLSLALRILGHQQCSKSLWRAGTPDKTQWSAVPFHTCRWKKASLDLGHIFPWWQNIIFSLWIIEDTWLAHNFLKAVVIVTRVLPVNMRSTTRFLKATA